MIQLSTGDMLRSAREAGTPVGLQVQRSHGPRRTGSDAIVSALIGEHLDSARDRGAIFDGYPRTLHQAEALEFLLGRARPQLDYVIELGWTKRRWSTASPAASPAPTVVPAITTGSTCRRSKALRRLRRT
jgi:adenylate kinase family enzyme